MCLWDILFIFVYLAYSEDAHIPLTRNSFSGPFQNTQYTPHWRLIGSAKIPIVGSNYIELTQMQQDQRGSVWNQVTLKPIDWEIKAHISFGPSNKPDFAAGIALWVTKEKESTGTAFGSNSLWTGLAVIFDTFDNNADVNSPLLYGVYNNGDKHFDHHKDEMQPELKVLGSCRVTRDQNAEHVIKVRYFSQRIDVSLQNKHHGPTSQFEHCFSATNILIPRDYYIGISSNTGGYLDHHKVHSVETFSISGEREQLIDSESIPHSEPQHEPKHEPQFEPQHNAHNQQQQQQHQQQQRYQKLHGEGVEFQIYDKEIKSKIELQIKKHIELESAILILAQEADDLFSNLEKKASDELRELQNKVVLLHPEVETLAGAKPSIVEVENSIRELQNALEQLERITNLENEKIDTLGTGFFFLPQTSGWDKWVWLLVLQSVGIIILIFVQKCRKPRKARI